MAKVEGKVIRVLGPTEVVINRGSEHGLASSARFIIFERGEEIRDPDTGESLGQLEIVRGKALVKHLQEKITTLRSSETKTIKKDRQRLKGEDLMFKISMLGFETVTEDVEVPAEFEGVKVGDLVREL